MELRVADLNWMQLEAYLERDDRIVLPLGSTEQHAYLSLETDNLLAEGVAKALRSTDLRAFALRGGGGTWP